MDSNRDGKVTAEEIRQALAVRDPLVKNVVNRLIVKHHSEWYGGRSTGRWEGFYKDLDSIEVKYCEKWQADLEWMSKVPLFDKDEAVWHFHPVVFLDAIIDKFTDVIEFQTTLGVYRISKKSAEFILSWEAYMPKPYVPEGDQSSGVTVGYGYDLGQQTTSSARALLSEYYSNSQVERLLSAIGKKGNEARAIVHELFDITIEKDKALDMAMVLKERYCQIVVDIYPQAIILPPDSAGAILSLVYNRGPSLALPKPGDLIDRRREMREIRDDLEQGNIKKIPERLRSMKRLWPHQRGLGLRRDGEAKLIENEIFC